MSFKDPFKEDQRLVILRSLNEMPAYRSQRIHPRYVPRKLWP